MRILVIACNYPPDPVIGAVRSGRIVDHLRGRGHEARVITAGGPWVPTDSDHTAIRSDWIDVRRMRRVKQAVTPTTTLAASLVGLPVSAKPRNHQGGRWQRHSPTRSKAAMSARWHLATTRGYVLDHPDEMVGWIPGAVRAGSRLLDIWKPDVIFASAPAFSSFVVASRLSASFGIPWVADYRDLWTTSGYYCRTGPRRSTDRWLEQKLLSTASLATAVTEMFVQDLSLDFGIRAELVRNGYDPVEVLPVSQRASLSPARLNLAYVGNNLYGGRRDPGALFQAARILGLTDEDIGFHFLGTDPILIAKLAAVAGVTELVHVHPSVPRSESLAFQSRADGLLQLMWNDPGEAGTYPGKMFEYIAVRRPILMVGYPRGVAADLLRSRRLGEVVSSVDEALPVLAAMVAAKDSPRLLPDLDESRREGLSRFEQNMRLEQLILEVAGLPRPQLRDPPD